MEPLSPLSPALADGATEPLSQLGRAPPALGLLFFKYSKPVSTGGSALAVPSIWEMLALDLAFTLPRCQLRCSSAAML